MARFQFRLETLLKIRINERQQKQTALAEALRAEAVLVENRQQLEAEIETSQKAARVASAPGPLNVGHLIDVHRYELVIQSQIGALDQQIEQIHAEVENRRSALTEADRQVRVLEKLREKQKLSFEQLEFQRETKNLDEVAIQRVGQRDRHE